MDAVPDLAGSAYSGVASAAGSVAMVAAAAVVTIASRQP